MKEEEGRKEGRKEGRRRKKRRKKRGKKKEETENRKKINWRKGRVKEDGFCSSRGGQRVLPPALACLFERERERTTTWWITRWRRGRTRRIMPIRRERRVTRGRGRKRKQKKEKEKREQPKTRGIGRISRRRSKKTHQLCIQKDE